MLVDRNLQLLYVLTIESQAGHAVVILRERDCVLLLKAFLEVLFEFLILDFLSRRQLLLTILFTIVAFRLLLINQGLCLFLAVKFFMVVSMIMLFFVLDRSLQRIKSSRKSPVNSRAQLHELGNLALQQDLVGHFEADGYELCDTPHALELVEPAEAESKCNAREHVQDDARHPKDQLDAAALSIGWEAEQDEQSNGESESVDDEGAEEHATEDILSVVI